MRTAREREGGREENGNEWFSRQLYAACVGIVVMGKMKTSRSLLTVKFALVSRSRFCRGKKHKILEAENKFRTAGRG